jgi:hypothetical protein
MPTASTNPFAAVQDAFAESEEAQGEWGVIWLDGVPLPVQGMVGYANLATFAPRLQIGDTSKSSDSFYSVWIFSDGSGGGQVEDLREPSHTERYEHGTAELRYPGKITQPPETVKVSLAGATGDATPVGDYAVSGTTYFWAAYGTSLRKWNKVGLVFDGGGTLTAAPVAKGVVYDDLLWIPQGASGYDTWNGTAVVHSNAVTPVSLVEWDDKLLALEHDGQVSIWDGATWSSPTELRLRGNRVPRHLVVWWSPERIPTVYIVTDRDVWAVDPLVPYLYRTGLRFPVHPDHGKGATAWRDDAMYVSTGIGVHQLSLGGVVSAMGLDRDDGLPINLRGAIVDMEPEYNGLLALAQGIGTVTTGSDEELGPRLEQPMIYDDQMVVPTATVTARCTLQRWTGIGWHTVWESAGAEGTATKVMVSQADGEYRLWWGYAGSMYTQVLRRTFHNPRQGASIGIDRFALSSSWKSGRFDANMEAFHKLASHFEIHLDPISQGTLTVRYRTDHFDGWRTLGTASAPGQTVLEFNPDADAWSEGESFHWIEFEHDLTNTDPLHPVFVNWTALKFVSLPLQTRSWRVQVPLSFETWLGYGPRELADHLDAMTTSERYVTFKHQDRTYRVRVAQVHGSDQTGKDFRGGRVLSIIEADSASEAS